MRSRSRVPFTTVPALAAAAAAIVVTVMASPAAAQAQRKEAASAAHRDPRWDAIARVFGQTGEAEGGYFRVGLPRSDLRVSIAGDTLSPRFEFTSYVGFMPTRAGVMAMGEVILRDDEVTAALDEARRQGVRVTALHNHLVGESPRIVYMHVAAEGAAATVAGALKAVFAKTATPLDRAPAEEPATADWSAVDAVLGPHSEAAGPVAEYVFPRNERLTVHGEPVKSTGTLETASEVVFERLGGGRVANTGELFVLPREVEPVLRALGAHGLHVTAVHNHTLDETPRMYWVHWYATGDGATLARGVAAALAHMNGARRAAKD